MIDSDGPSSATYLFATSPPTAAPSYSSSKAETNWRRALLQLCSIPMTNHAVVHAGTAFGRADCQDGKDSEAAVLKRHSEFGIRNVEVGSRDLGIICPSVR